MNDGDLVHPDLFEDDFTLDLEIGRADRGTQQAGQGFEHGGKILGEHGGVEHRRLFAGRRVVPAADLVKDAIHVVGRVFAVPFEGHVSRMAHSRDLGRFVALPRADKEGGGNRQHAGIQLGDGRDAVGELRLMELHGVPPAVWVRW